MTPDQIYFRLAQTEIIKKRSGLSGTTKVPGGVAPNPDKAPPGYAWGRREDGTRVLARVGGKSMAQIIREREEAERAAQQEKPASKSKKRRR